MQVYKGLDIITNKPTELEKGSIPHHMFDFVEPGIEYSVIQFQRDALKIIDKIHAEGQIPIIVGGTNYYIQSLLWETGLTISLDNEGFKANGMSTCHSSIANTGLATEINEILQNTDSKVHLPGTIKEYCQKVPILETLAKVDEKMGQRWHANDWRKIRRSLEIYFVTGKSHTEAIKNQKRMAPKLRFPACVFWLYAKPEILNPRLDARVGEMVKVSYL